MHVARRVTSNPHKNISFGNKEDGEEDENEDTDISNASLISKTRNRLQQQVNNFEESTQTHLLPWAGHVPVRQSRTSTEEDEERVEQKVNAFSKLSKIIN